MLKISPIKTLTWNKPIANPIWKCYVWLYAVFQPGTRLIARLSINYRVMPRARYFRHYEFDNILQNFCIFKSSKKSAFIGISLIMLIWFIHKLAVNYWYMYGQKFQNEYYRQNHIPHCCKAHTVNHVFVYNTNMSDKWYLI